MAKPNVEAQLRDACGELDDRLRAGHDCHAEEYLAMFPELAADSDAALELIYAEYVARQRRGEQLQNRDWFERFPRWRDMLARLFEVHDLARTDGLANPAPVADAVGWQIGPYKLVEKLGEGGMGAVFIAEQEQPVKRQVALKIIKAGMDSEQVIRRFEIERQALAMMDHSNIAKVLDAGTIPEHVEGGLPAGRPYFVMELVKGQSITTYCNEMQLSIRERLALFVPVCHAIQHAHQKGIIHRDIKPSNVLVCMQDGKPVPKVIDFGVAKAMHTKLSEETMNTEIGAILGTLEYMSPEQAELSSLDIDTRTDVYALGVVLYELLTGTTPLNRQRQGHAAFSDVLRVIREEEPPRPSTRLSDSDQLPTLAEQRRTAPTQLTKQVRGELDWITMKCLEKDRSRRYETADALARDIERYLSDESVEACPPSVSYKLRKFLRRHRAAVLAASIATSALLVGFAGVTIGLVEVHDQRDAAEAARVQESRQRSEAIWQRDRAVGAEKLASQRLAQVELEKQRADDSLAIAQAVRDFLQHDLFGQASIENQQIGASLPERNPKITVRELLDRAEKRVTGKFQGQPLTDAAVRFMIATTYDSIGEHALALPHAEIALKLQVENLGPDHHEALHTKHVLARLYRALGKEDLAESMLQQLLEAQKDSIGVEHKDALAAMSDLATLYMVRGKYELAKPLFEEATRGYLEQFGPHDMNTLSSQNNLAMFLIRAYGKADEAEQMLREAIELAENKHGRDHPGTLRFKHNLAEQYLDSNRVGLAAPLIQEVYEIRLDKMGPRNPDTLNSMNSLAGLYKEQGNYKEAEKLYVQMIDAQTANLGPNHRITLLAKNNLGTLYWTMKRLDLSIPLFEETVHAMQQHVGENHPSTLGTQANLGVNYLEAGKIPQAIESLERAWEQGQRHPHLRWMARPLATAYEKASQFDKAEPVQRAAFERARGLYGPNDSRTGNALAQLGANLLAQQKWVECESVLRECRSIRSMRDTSKWATFHVQSMHGAALLGQAKYADAEPLLLEGYRGLKQLEGSIPAADAKRVAEALRRLVQLYEEWGKSAEAANWSKLLGQSGEPN
jgi:serine/threonine protein kinase/tetratricopeptide (TPR) repeat protein